MARTITGNREQSDLFAASDVDEATPVRLKRIRLELADTAGAAVKQF